MQQRWWLIASGVGLCIVAYLLWPRAYCRSALDGYGITVPICPDGRVRQTLQLSAQGLRRGGEGSVTLRATALYTVAAADAAQRAVIPALEAKLFLVDAQGQEKALQPYIDPKRPRQPAWTRGVGTVTTTIKLPRELDDGDYKLRAKVTTKVGKGVVDLPLAVYAPARIHVLTDRPLYQAGHRIRFRALAVRARDLAPLDNRPGRWIVRDPAGTVLLEQKAPADAWGVVAGDFPLEAGAAKGRWTIVWRSGDAEGQATVRVEPFTLPRFRITAEADKPFYRAGDQPTVRGRVVYSSGAPVQQAKVELNWSFYGRWPPPTSWSDDKGGLPKKTTTDARGAFELRLPMVPQDLQGNVVLAASLAAMDPAGDRVEGSVNVLLAQDAIAVSAFTPLSAGGLVAGFNNRLYLRVTTVDGRPLPGAKIDVSKAWLGTGEGVSAELDADSVARIQIDPGRPVNVVVPRLPRRKRKVERTTVTRSRAKDLVADVDAPLSDLVEMDRWPALIAPCAKWRSDEQSSAELALRVSAAGAIVRGVAMTVLARCVLERVRRRRFPAGQPRWYALTFDFDAPPLPKVTTEIAPAIGDDVPEPVSKLVALAARDARDCLPTQGSGPLPWVLSYRVAAKATRPTFDWIKRRGAEGQKMPRGIDGCLLGRLRKHALEKPLEHDAEGVVRYTLAQADAKSGGSGGSTNPRVLAGRATVRGGLDKEIIRRIVRRHINELKFCYQRELQNDDGLMGRLVLRFSINPAGRVIASKVLSSTLGNAKVEFCVAAAVRRWLFPKPQGGGSVLVAYPFIFRSGAPGSERIMRGYELLVSATRPDGKGGTLQLGQTKLRLRPGQVPRIAVRAEPVLARAGETVTVRLIRGPRFRGKLPRAIRVTHFGDSKQLTLPKGARPGKYSYKLPADAKGWYVFEAEGKRALVFVRSTAQLAVAVEPAQKRYKPGAQARLRVQTRVGKRGAPAMVGLFGVDQSLGQLVTLPGPDALRGLRPKVAMQSKAFGYLDAQALVLGRIRGGRAAEATVLKVASIPTPEKLDIVVGGSAATQFDANTELVDRFYVVLAALHEQVRQWERAAPKTELMRPPRLAALWKRALEATEAKGKSVKDAFGRRLRLHRLPADLLALTDPRQVVTEGTRLPEDTENWTQWVQRRKP